MFAIASCEANFDFKKPILERIGFILIKHPKMKKLVFNESLGSNIISASDFNKINTFS